MFEIAGGIILAVLFFRFLPLIVGGGIVLFGIVVVVGLVAAAYFNMKIVGMVIGTLGFIAIVYGIPFYLYGVLMKRYPHLADLVHGRPPHNTFREFPERFFVCAAIAIAVASVGAGAFWGMAYGWDYAEKNFAAKEK